MTSNTEIKQKNNSIDPKGSIDYKQSSYNREFKNSLRCTRACKSVSGHFLNFGKFGCCTREVCDFAHSYTELRGPPCMKGDECDNINGRWNYTLTMYYPDSGCMYKHPSETFGEWVARTNMILPPLPVTSESSYNPIPRISRVILSGKNEIFPELIIGNTKKSSTLYHHININSPDKKIRRKKKDITRVIEVSNTELAEFAIKTAIEKGEYGIKIVIVE